MKFLGEYSSETANIYKDKLEGEDIFATIEEVGGYFGGSFATMGSIKPRIRLTVEDNDYDKAVNLIKDLEKNFETKVAVDGKEADKVMIKVVMVLVCLFTLAIYLTYLRK